jgi:hypothetical protein
MLARFIFLLILVSSTSAFADKIVAVVEKNPITLSDIENRRNLIIALQKINKDPNKQNLKDFDKHIYEMLVQERMVENQAQISEANISAEELQNSIAADEKSKKFQPGYMKKTLGQLLFSDYMRYVNGQILWSRMINDTLASIKVLPQESDYLILSSNSKDMDLRFYELRSKKYSVLKSLKERLGALKEMKKISESSSLKIDDTSARFTSLNIDVQNIIKNLQIGDTSSITLDGDEFRMFFLDDKKFVGLSKEEMMFVNQIVGNQKAEMLVKQINNFMKKRTFISKIAS